MQVLTSYTADPENNAEFRLVKVQGACYVEVNALSHYTVTLTPATCPPRQ